MASFKQYSSTDRGRIAQHWADRMGWTYGPCTVRGCQGGQIRRTDASLPRDFKMVECTACEGTSYGFWGVPNPTPKPLDIEWPCSLIHHLP